MTFDDNDAGGGAPPPPPPSSSSIHDHHQTFPTLCASIGIDPRLRKSLSRMGIVRPTLVQSRAIPLAVSSGRDLLVRARTGSGKTLAYTVPVLQKILARKALLAERRGGGAEVGDGGDDGDDGDDDGSGRGGGRGGGGTAVGGVILVPTRELCDQVSRVLDDLTYYCADAIKVVVLSSSSSSSFNNGTKGKREMMRQEALLRDRPDVVVATPAGLVAHVRSGALDLRRTVETLVVDEADLILSFGEWMRASVRVRPMILYTRIPLYRVYIYFIPHWMIYNYG